MHSKQLITIIKERRSTLHVTQEALAEVSGVGLRTLKAFESGKGNPTVETLHKIAEPLGLELTFQVKKMEND